MGIDTRGEIDLSNGGHTVAGNRNYNLVISKLSVDEKEKLKSSQRNWILYRDKELEFARTMYINLQGTMWRIVSTDRQTELTRQRALELKAYYDNLP